MPVRRGLSRLVLLGVRALLDTDKGRAMIDLYQYAYWDLIILIRAVKSLRPEGPW